MSTHAKVLQACFAFLVPVARLLLRCGVTYREFAEISRLAFVDVASSDFGIRGRPTNVSRVSAMTGIGRKEISRLRRMQRNFDSDLQKHLRSHFNPLGDVLHYWFTDERYLIDGEPKPLRFKGVGSFDELVRRCAGDLPAGAVKVELVRCGAVEELDTGELVPRRRVLIPNGVDEKVITYLATRLRGLALTAVHNCTPEVLGDSWLEREVYSTRIPREAIDKLRPIVKAHVSMCARQIDDMVSKVEEPGFMSDTRLGIGFFYYEDSQ